jgi:hypothetical protein
MDTETQSVKLTKDIIKALKPSKAAILAELETYQIRGNLETTCNTGAVSFTGYDYKTQEWVVIYDV